MVGSRPIRFHLMGLVFAAVIPVLLFGVIVAVLFERQHRASLEQSLRDTARALTVAVDHELISSLSTLQALTTSEHLDSGDLRRFYESAQRVLHAHRGWRTINLFNRAGQHLISLLRPFGTILPSTEIRAVVRQTLDTGEPAVSDLFVGSVAQAQTVAVAVPVIRGGTLIYVLEAGLDLAALSRLLFEGKLPPDWVATIIDRHGIIVARTWGIEQWLGKPAPPEFVAQSRHVEEGSFSDVTRDGIPVYAAYSHSRLSGWTVGLGAPLASIEGPRQVSLLTLTSGAIALLLLAGGLATVFGRRIATAIGSLSASARALGQGQLIAGSGESGVSEVDAVERELGEAARARADAIAARVRTEEELAQYAERLRILRDIDRAMIAAEEPEAIAEAALVGLRDLIGVPRTIVNLFDLEAGEAEWLAAAGRRRIHRGPGVRFSLTLMGDVEALRRGEPQVIDVDALPPSPEAEALLASGVHIYMVVPMIAGGELIGGLSFGVASGPFLPEQVSIVQEVATQLAIVIAQARLYERVRHHAEELEERVHERTAELEAANHELEAFTYTVSHDLRAPLRAADGFSRILLTEHAPHLAPDAQRYLRLVRDNTQQMGQLIDDLLAFSRLSRQPLNVRPIVLTDLVRQVLEDLHVAQAGRCIDISIGDLPVCQADAALLKQVLINLFSNAIKFTSKREVASIAVGCRREDDQSVYFIKDNGVGFDMRYADKLFGVFQRLHRAEEYEGTGVGLAIVQRIIHRHGGRIWAEAAVDQGTTFYFTLGGNTRHG
jgi:signal transduction histidine kinase